MKNKRATLQRLQLCRQGSASKTFEKASIVRYSFAAIDNYQVSGSQGTAGDRQGTRPRYQK